MDNSQAFRELLKEAVDFFGKENFLNDKQILAYISDMGPQYKKEKKRLKMLYSDGAIMPKLYHEMTTTANVQMSVAKYSSYLVDEYAINEEIAEEYVIAIGYALTGQVVERQFKKQEVELHSSKETVKSYEQKEPVIEQVKTSPKTTTGQTTQKNPIKTVQTKSASKQTMNVNTKQQTMVKTTQASTNNSGSSITSAKSQAEDSYQKGLAGYKAKDYSVMFKNMKAASDLGHIEATYYMGIMYEQGLHVLKDEAKAIGLYDIARKKGHSEAERRAAQLRNQLKQGTGKTVSYKKTASVSTETKTLSNSNAVKQTSKATSGKVTQPVSSVRSSSVAKAKNEAEDLYLKGLNGWRNKDYSVMYKNMKAASDLGHIEATYYMGIMYEQGLHVLKDEAKAIGLYDIARKKGHDGAALKHQELKNKLMLAAGQKVASAKPKQVSTNLDNIDYQGIVDSMYNKGLSFYKAHDYENAFKYMQAAAEMDHGVAAYYLGYLYQMGYGTTMNKVEAVKWYEKSATKGYAFAQDALGYMYYKGEGVTQNDVEALNLFRRAASQGNRQAQFMLGQLYEFGRGVEQNKEVAKSWYEKSASQGYEASKQALKRMEIDRNLEVFTKKEINNEAKMQSLNQGTVKSKKPIWSTFWKKSNED